MYQEFLSYLWGMETSYENKSYGWILTCSYPTYEEWKLQEQVKDEEAVLCSYPTYEEWKPHRKVDEFRFL